MLKKSITLIVALAYLMLTSGIVVDMHYCMGKLAAVDFKHSAGSACQRCGMSKTGCCKDELKVVKLDDSHQQSVVNATVDFAQAPVQILSQEWQSGLSGLQAQLTPVEHSPPDVIAQTSLPLLCVFRI